jgi:hypothetical protein
MHFKMHQLEPFKNKIFFAAGEPQKAAKGRKRWFHLQQMICMHIGVVQYALQGSTCIIMQHLAHCAQCLVPFGAVCCIWFPLKIQKKSIKLMMPFLFLLKFQSSNGIAALID